MSGAALWMRWPAGVSPLRQQKQMHRQQKRSVALLLRLHLSAPRAVLQTWLPAAAAVALALGPV